MVGLYACIHNRHFSIHLIQSHGFISTRRNLCHYTEEVRDARDRLFAAIKVHFYLSELMWTWFYFSYMEAKSQPAEEKCDAVAIEW